MDDTPLLFVIGTSLLVLLLSVLPLPSWGGWFWPAWSVLLVAYWQLDQSRAMSVGSAFALGIGLDLLMGTLLGEHALALVLVVTLLHHSQRQMRMYPQIQQALIIGALTLLYCSLRFVVEALQGNYETRWLFWLPTLSSALLWPWWSSILRRYRRQR